ncbi:hypothetical protein BQ8794_70023 [Mesorhizobium prunaredense]|uniref:Uncharacterized protein n=1 Tax=Mesorhizobium prunaredense TaxID=1631249 RepID=A0A1R3VGR8_9HYPH|nr:hypothetical protein BQ8794_70023 [Mesorhizobium prunaredense]
MGKPAICQARRRAAFLQGAQLQGDLGWGPEIIRVDKRQKLRIGRGRTAVAGLRNTGVRLLYQAYAPIFRGMGGHD